MQLASIVEKIPDCQVFGSKDLEITGMSANSQSIHSGNLFIAKKGMTHDGRKYVGQAIENGAIAVACDEFDSSIKGITQIIHPQISEKEGVLASHFYRNPSQELFIVGITGTNGKTTSSFLIKNMLDSVIGSTGVIGTIEYVVGAHRYPATKTTPDVITNHRLLREMRDQNCSCAVMEVSSHALDQKRVEEIDFDVAVFTNLTLDHLDYHLSMEQYATAKKKLFDGIATGRKTSPKWAIVNRDSDWTPYLLQDCTANVFSYGIDRPADLQATHLFFRFDGTVGTLHYQGNSHQVFFPLVGKFNVYNCLAAIAVGITQNISLEKMLEALRCIVPVRGRLQPVKNELGLQIFVDFAHTDDALVNVLSTLQAVKKGEGRLIVVFGSGGERDRTKRSKMGEASEKYADFSIITSDNPRSEDPHQICKEIAEGFKNPNQYHVEPDRFLAIKKAIEMSSCKDMIVLAGKGHETYQVFADMTIPFDDYQVAVEICDHIFRNKKTCFV